MFCLLLELETAFFELLDFSLSPSIRIPIVSGIESLDLIELLDLAELLDTIFFALELDIIFDELLNLCVLLVDDFCCTTELDDNLVELDENVILLDEAHALLDQGEGACGQSL